MKDLLGQFGWVILGVIIVFALILGYMADTAQEGGDATNTQVEKTLTEMKGASLDNPAD